MLKALIGKLSGLLEGESTPDGPPLTRSTEHIATLEINQEPEIVPGHRMLVEYPMIRGEMGAVVCPYCQCSGLFPPVGDYSYEINCSSCGNLIKFINEKSFSGMHISLLTGSFDEAVGGGMLYSGDQLSGALAPVGQPDYSPDVSLPEFLRQDVPNSPGQQENVLAVQSD